MGTPDETWASIEAKGPLNGKDLKRSRAYYEADLQRAVGSEIGKYVRDWLNNLYAFEDYYAVHQRVPRRRAKFSDNDPVEQHLARWLTRQRLRELTMTEYQAVRLADTPGFVWNLRGH